MFEFLFTRKVKKPSFQTHFVHNEIPETDMGNQHKARFFKHEVRVGLVSNQRLWDMLQFCGDTFRQRCSSARDGKGDWEYEHHNLRFVFLNESDALMFRMMF